MTYKFRSLFLLPFLFPPIPAYLISSHQVDTVLLNDLLREILDSSISDLRRRLQEAVFAAAYRRRIEGMEWSRREAPEIVDKILDEFIQKSKTLKSMNTDPAPQKLSLALETYTTTTPSTHPIRLITASSLSDNPNPQDPFIKSSRFLHDDPSPPPLPRIPIWVGIMVCTTCALTFILFIATIAYYFATRKRPFTPRPLPDPLTIGGLEVDRSQSVIYTIH